MPFGEGGYGESSRHAKLQTPATQRLNRNAVKNALQVDIEQLSPVAAPDRLRGSYLFAARGFNIVGGIAQPKAILEAIVFNGDGTLTVPAVTVSVNGVITRPPAGSGDYTVLENCTGTVVFTSGPSFDIFIAPDGKTVWMIQTNPNTVFQGTATQVER